MRTTVFFLFLTCLAPLRSEAARPKLELHSDWASLSVDLGGGSIDGFQLKGDGLNPLTWDSGTASAGSEPQPRPMGHFLCLDRWGPPSEAEKARGMPFHGEAARVWWTVDAASEREAKLSAALPLAGFRVERTIVLDKGSPLARVTETVTNQRALGRIYNCVQHPTVGPPFLDESVLVDCNGTRGFMQDRPMPSPEAEEVAWPKAKTLDGELVDVRRLFDDPSPNVVSYTVAEGEIGWVSALNPKKGLLLVYLWPREDYPWINLWRHVKDGKPVARGLEFGTTGLHKPFPDLAAKKSIFGESLFRYIDAGETQRLSYAVLLQKTPTGFRGVERIALQNGVLRIEERDGDRVLTVEAPDLFR